MRETFISNSMLNEGYPTFADANELYADTYYINIFHSENYYPEYINKHFNFNSPSNYSEYIFYTIPDINNGYPSYLHFEGLVSSSKSDIFFKNCNTKQLYLNEQLIKLALFNDKIVYHYGFLKI